MRIAGPTNVLTKAAPYTGGTIHVAQSAGRFAEREHSCEET